MKRSIVLLEPSGVRKGVLLLKFTNTFSFPLRRGFLNRFMDRFVVVLEPSWAGYADADILQFTKRPDPVFVESADRGDSRLLAGLGCNLVPLPLGSGCWVDHRVFRPLADTRKDFDVVYVANSNYYKRMHAFMRLVHDLRKQLGRARGAMVCSAWGTDLTEAQELAAAYGVSSEIELFADLPADALNHVLNRSRFTLLMSRKEGSNKTLFESMFADTPVALIAENVGVCREHIPAEAGLVVPEDQMAAVLAGSLNTGHAKRFEPRKWALEHISPEVSTTKLERAIQAQLGWPSPVNLKVKINVPELRYMTAQAEPAELVRQWIDDLW